MPEPEPEMIYWINVNRPDMQFRTNGLIRWQRKVTEEKWTYFDSFTFTLPSEWRYVVSEQELQDRTKEV